MPHRIAYVCANVLSYIFILWQMLGNIIISMSTLLCLFKAFTVKPFLCKVSSRRNRILGYIYSPKTEKEWKCNIYLENNSVP